MEKKHSFLLCIPLKFHFDFHRDQDSCSAHNTKHLLEQLKRLVFLKTHSNIPYNIYFPKHCPKLFIQNTNNCKIEITPKWWIMFNHGMCTNNTHNNFSTWKMLFVLQEYFVWKFFRIQRKPKNCAQIQFDKI